jgi:hypothetical protein
MIKQSLHDPHTASTIAEYTATLSHLNHTVQFNLLSDRQVKPVQSKAVLLVTMWDSLMQRIFELETHDHIKVSREV